MAVPIVAAGALDRRRQLTIGRVSDRAISTASAAAHNTAISPTSTEVFWIAAAGAMMTAFGTVLMTATHSIAGQNGRRERDAARPSGLIRHDSRDALRRAERCGERREVAPPVGRRAQLGAEFAGGVGVNEIVAAFVDDVDVFPRPRR